MSTSEVIAHLRAQLSTLTGRARIGPLTHLGQALADAYWRAGPGQPHALPTLEDAITTFDEAYNLLEVGDPMRGAVAGRLGWMFAAQCTAHGGSEHHRETGIHLLEESLAFPDVPSLAAAVQSVVLAQLYLSRVVQGPRFAELALTAMTSAASSAMTADVDRAAACCRRVLDAPTTSAEVTAAARTTLTMVEAVQAMLGGIGGVAGFDLSKLMQALALLQKIQTEGFGGAGQFKLPFPVADDLARRHPLDRPVTVARGPEPAPPAVPPPRRVTTPAAQVDRADLRRALHWLWTDHSGHAEVWAAAAARLEPSHHEPADFVDEAVALATLVTDGPPDPDPVIAGVDRFLLAVALALRDRQGSAGEDHGAAVAALVDATRTIPAGHPAAAAAILAIGAFLDDKHPMAALGDAAAGLADRADLVMATAQLPGAELATVHALRCVCRAAADRRTVGELRRAVATAPPSYPWSARLRAAVAEAEVDCG